MRTRALISSGLVPCLCDSMAFAEDLTAEQNGVILNLSGRQRKGGFRTE